MWFWLRSYRSNVAIAVDAFEKLVQGVSLVVEVKTVHAVASLRTVGGNLIIPRGRALTTQILSLREIEKCIVLVIVAQGRHLNIGRTRLLGENQRLAVVHIKIKSGPRRSSVGLNLRNLILDLLESIEVIGSRNYPGAVDYDGKDSDFEVRRQRRNWGFGLVEDPVQHSTASLDRAFVYPDSPVSKFGVLVIA